MNRKPHSQRCSPDADTHSDTRCVPYQAYRCNTYIQTRSHAHTHPCMHVYTYIRMCMYAYRYINIHTIHTHTLSLTSQQDDVEQMSKTNSYFDIHTHTHTQSHTISSDIVGAEECSKLYMCEVRVFRCAARVGCVGCRAWGVGCVCEGLIWAVGVFHDQKHIHHAHPPRAPTHPPISSYPPTRHTYSAWCGSR